MPQISKPQTPCVNHTRGPLFWRGGGSHGKKGKWGLRLGEQNRVREEQRCPYSLELGSAGSGTGRGGCGWTAGINASGDWWGRQVWGSQSYGDWQRARFEPNGHRAYLGKWAIRGPRGFTAVLGSRCSRWRWGHDGGAHLRDGCLSHPLQWSSPRCSHALVGSTIKLKSTLGLG